jgi:hypothetical protein
MKVKNFKLIVFIGIWFPFINFAQSFTPAAGDIGTTAIHKDSLTLVSWANGIELHRGYLNISNKSLGFANFGLAENALNQAEGNSFDVVSLGDSGVAILTFPNPIKNGNGFDFAVFENSFADDYLEYAFVEVSSDGINFVRFPPISETQTSTQIDGLGLSDCRNVNNLAGKYRQGFGTPFDLEELVALNQQNIDLDNITHIKIIDVIGSINAQFGTFDSQGNIINEPWPSEFDSGGFDLDGIGVLNHVVGFEEKKNPFSTLIKIEENLIFNLTDNKFVIKIYDLTGKITLESIENQINIQRLNSGIYFLKIEFQNQENLIRFFKK